MKILQLFNISTLIAILEATYSDTSSCLQTHPPYLMDESL